MNAEQFKLMIFEENRRIGNIPLKATMHPRTWADIMYTLNICDVDFSTRITKFKDVEVFQDPKITEGQIDFKPS